MSLLVFIIVVIILLALAVAAIGYLPENIVGQPFKSLIIVLAFLIAIVVIAQRAGVF